MIVRPNSHQTSAPETKHQGRLEIKLLPGSQITLTVPSGTTETLRGDGNFEDCYDPESRFVGFNSAALQAEVPEALRNSREMTGVIRRLSANFTPDPYDQNVEPRFQKAPGVEKVGEELASILDKRVKVTFGEEWAARVVFDNEGVEDVSYTNKETGQTLGLSFGLEQGEITQASLYSFTVKGRNSFSSSKQNMTADVDLSSGAIDKNSVVEELDFLLMD
ncbi:MAG: hypothetical protein KC800_21715 [Candidatus Eremiobacteraeota bacterium]|nr:hypothetical protein [Candidatus Eremiobacteraeota bacterium]